MSEEKKKRLIVPNFKRGSITEVEKVQDIESTVGDAKIALANEIARYKNKSFAKPLDLKEARVFAQLIDSLVKLSKESREVAKAFDVENMSDEELTKELKELLGEAKEREK